MFETAIEKINIYNIENEIRCVMCTNPYANDYGCDGGCQYNKELYNKVMNVINERLIKEGEKYD